MTLHPTFKLAFCAIAALSLAACATPAKSGDTMASAPAAKTESMKDVSERLSSTQNVTKSADGEMICKRQTVVGSNFKRKVCATKAQWDAQAEASRKTTGDIQRRKAPGVGN